MDDNAQLIEAKSDELSADFLTAALKFLQLKSDARKQVLAFVDELMAEQ